jgi:hypothetical protein
MGRDLTLVCMRAAVHVHQAILPETDSWHHAQNEVWASIDSSSACVLQCMCTKLHCEAKTPDIMARMRQPS